MDARCDTCGLVAPAEARFRTQTRRLPRRTVTECPRCWDRRQQRVAALVVGVLGAGVALACAALLLIVLLAPFDTTVPRFLLWAAASVLVFAALLYPLVLAREVGRALIARLLGLHVFGIVFLEGPAIWRMSFAGIPVTVGAWFLVPTAATSYAHPSRRWLRIGDWLVALAGPLTTALLLSVALMPILYLEPSAFDGAELVRWFAWVLVAAGGLLLVNSLVPRWWALNGQPLPSDGLQLVSIPFQPREAVDAAHGRFFGMHGEQCLLTGQPDEALAWFRRGLDAYPDDPHCTLGIGRALLARGDDSASLAYCRDAMTRKDLPPAFRAVLADTAGTAALHLIMAGRASVPPDVEETLHAGEVCCDMALSFADAVDIGTQASFQGTLGCLLVEKGCLDEGDHLLRIALARLDDPSSRAYGFAYLAVAAARRGDMAEARAHLDEARRLDPEHAAVRRAQLEVPLTPPGASPAPR